MAKIILVCGGIGAGKSTYAQKITTEQQAVYFATDEWMVTLYHDDLIAEIQYKWAQERIERIESQIYSMAKQLLERGLTVVFDLGLLQRAHRQKFYDLAKQDGFKIETHILDVDKSIRWQRVEKRNQEKGDTFSAEVTREMFDFCETLFERPVSEEREQCIFI